MTPLSVCCLTNDRPATVAAMLATFRPVADEIFVALDSRVDPRAIGPLRDVADTVVRYEYAGTPERARPWLVASCRNPTVLMIDGDEAPSQALLAAIPELVDDSGVAQFRVARRWVFPDERTWLDERPWFPDFQRRIVRRGPQLDFDLQFHGGVRAASPVRLVMDPIYHLACLVMTVGARRRAARAYDAHRPGLVAVGGGPMNDTLYVPEHFATRRPVATPDDDVVVIREILGVEDPPPTVGDLPLVSAAEIDRHTPVDPLELQGYLAELRIVESDLRTDPGNDTHLLVEVLNTGSAVIPCDDADGAQVRVATRLAHPGAGHLGSSLALTPLPCAIPQGHRRVVEAIVSIPSVAGRYDVEVDLLNERGRWFGCVTSVELTVTTRWGRFSL